MTIKVLVHHLFWYLEISLYFNLLSGIILENNTHFTMKFTKLHLAFQAQILNQQVEVVMPQKPRRKVCVWMLICNIATVIE